MRVPPPVSGLIGSSETQTNPTSPRLVLPNETTLTSPDLPVSWHGTGTLKPSFIRAINQGIATFSQPWLKRLAKEGYECRVADFVSQALPPDYAKTPQNQPEGMTFDHLMGLHIDKPLQQQHLVIVAQKARPMHQTMMGYLWPSRFDWEWNPSPATVLHHELGHAAAQIASVVRDQACLKAFRDDREGLPPELRSHAIMNSPAEVMGCLSASLLGQGGLPHIPSKTLLAAWPTLAPAVEQKLKETLGFSSLG